MDNAQNRRADDKRAPGQLQWGESGYTIPVGSVLTGAIAAAPILTPDIVMHGLRITKDGITYNGQEIKDAGVVHAALMGVLSGKPLPPASPSAASIEGLTRYSAVRGHAPTMAPCPLGDYYLTADVERLLAAQSAKQGPQPSAWISVDERLPELGQKVIAYRPTAAQTSDPTINIIRYTGRERESWQGVKHGFDCICHPTHWMPLPAAPGTQPQAAPEQAAQVQADVRDQALAELIECAEAAVVDMQEWMQTYGENGGTTTTVKKLNAAIRAMKSKRAASTDGEARDE
ncbi:DUF551 domain-containing protein [Herbaspirillum sp. SJZ107]|uniref:DUF551 domain-containing protein n=1 Tax=Herbaspirillum sp. SJZ107 TaxID=2572881 RepID=UPI001153CEB8|nr:DUF551 domain-containing protein [Herbaspirillum sp. SJZ107]TQK10196.1 uncharacterized protein DUF551 [Herbaspirillum sp. SJZ107]